MAYGTVNFYSNVFGQDMEVDFLLPDTRRRALKWTDWKDRKFPVIWLLHGNSDSRSSWVRKSNIELFSKLLDVIIIMPSCNREFYTDSQRGLNFFTYITEELPIVMKNYLPISDKREENFIMGNSMGGYGALKCAFNYPEKYGAVASLSGAVSIIDNLSQNNNDEMSINLKYIFGSSEKFLNTENDVFYLIEHLKEKEFGNKIKVYQCCGKEDFVYDGNVKLYDALRKSIDTSLFEYKEGHGGHDWFYWNQRLSEIFSFFGFEVNDDHNDSGIFDIDNKKF
ncbi:MAG: prolyl oligopeptidase family serine peptidase [Erysipelotrichaceae bacterium]|nr:prolyl oligopeptidase family serine peptidase [Erysipelotrichaceae bacterium]